GTRWPILNYQDYALTLGTSYQATYARNTTPPLFDPSDQGPSFPDTGRFHSALVSLVFSNVHAYLGAISAQDGHTLQLTTRMEAPWLGSQHEATVVTARWTHYLQNPWAPRQVLASDVSMGWGRSNYKTGKLFGVGGLSARDLLLDSLAERFDS